MPTYLIVFGVILLGVVVYYIYKDIIATTNVADNTRFDLDEDD